MKRRKIYVIAGILILIGAVFFANRLISSSKNTTTNKTEKEPKPVVEVIQADPKTIQTYVDLTGRLIPSEKIDIYAEVQGLFRDYGKPFKTGIEYQQGEVLLSINADEVKQRLVSQKSEFKSLLAGVVPDLKFDYPELYPAYKDYLLNLEIDKPIEPLPDPKTEQQKLFLIGRNLYSRYHQIEELESRLDKYTIYAPYDGTLTETFVNDGTLIRPNMKVGEFVKNGAFELEAAVSPSDLQYLTKGQEVRLVPVDSEKSYTGKIDRINAKIDRNTQTVKVFIAVYSDDLYPGVYMEGEVEADKYENAFTIERDYLFDDNSLFIIQDSIAKIHEVELKKFEQDEAIISGVPKGRWIIAEEQTRAFEGKKVSPVKKDNS